MYFVFNSTLSPILHPRLAKLFFALDSDYLTAYAATVSKTNPQFCSSFASEVFLEIFNVADFCVLEEPIAQLCVANSPSTVVDVQVQPVKAGPGL